MPNQQCIISEKPFHISQENNSLDIALNGATWVFSSDQLKRQFFPVVFT